MKKVVLGVLAVMACLSGCAATGGLDKHTMSSSRHDVFLEVGEGGAIPQGYADLQIVFSVKTHNPVTVSKEDVHGTADYTMLLNVDGQAVQVQAKPRRENSEPVGLRDPEAGDGTRYNFSKKIRLTAGSHSVVVAMPADDIAVQWRLDLVEGKVNELIVEPVYAMSAERPRLHTYTHTGFKHGLRTIRFSLND